MYDIFLLIRFASFELFVFPLYEKQLSGKKCHSNEDKIVKINAYLAIFDQPYNWEEVYKLEQGWAKCLSRRGDYVGKWKWFNHKNKELFFVIRTFQTTLVINKYNINLAQRTCNYFINDNATKVIGN